MPSVRDTSELVHFAANLLNMVAKHGEGPPV